MITESPVSGDRGELLRVLIQGTDDDGDIGDPVLADFIEKVGAFWFYRGEPYFSLTEAKSAIIRRFYSDDEWRCQLQLDSVETFNDRIGWKEPDLA